MLHAGIKIIIVVLIELYFDLIEQKHQKSLTQRGFIKLLLKFTLFLPFKISITLPFKNHIIISKMLHFKNHIFRQNLPFKNPTILPRLHKNHQMQ